MWKHFIRNSGHLLSDFYLSKFSQKARLWRDITKSHCFLKSFSRDEKCFFKKEVRDLVQNQTDQLFSLQSTSTFWPCFSSFNVFVICKSIPIQKYIFFVAKSSSLYTFLHPFVHHTVVSLIGILLQITNIFFFGKFMNVTVYCSFSYTCCIVAFATRFQINQINQLFWRLFCLLADVSPTYWRGLPQGNVF